ncbi:MAG TPA: site-2 protease family protein [Candidatus Eisenbacteria bacterium]|nr:site-2 protease family protein [Candidatus Eisenbacteria bacterium]
MRWSWRIATVAGIPIRVHVTFGLLLVFIFGVHLAGGRDVVVALEGVGLVLAVFACVVLHEFGHALTARRYGVKTRDITILPIGGVAALERIPEKPFQEIVVALAGPAVNLAIACVLLIPFSSAVRGLDDPAGIARVMQGHFWSELFAINVFLAVFNLVPAFPMDGGRVLRALLATRLDYVRATRVAATVGQGIAFLFGLIGLFGNPMLLFVALFVFIGAGQEAAAVQMRSAFDGVPVARAMVREFHALRESAPLSQAVELLLAGSQQDFPVLEDGPEAKPVGVLMRADLLTALAGGDTSRPIRDVLKRTCGTAHPLELLEAVFRRMEASGCQAMPVVDDAGRVVGLLTLENVGELAAVHAALKRSAPR